MEYRYKVYGIFIKSDIEIKEFLKIKEINNDYIEICKADMPQKIKNDIDNGKHLCIDKNEIWFDASNIAVYRIMNGNQINYEPYDNADQVLLRVYLMCSCLGFIMIQRNKVAIHGGSIVINNNAVIVTGARGAGKSTLTTALRKQGYKFLADDVSAISIIDDEIQVESGFPYQKLCCDAMDQFKYDKRKYSSFIAGNKKKFIVSAKNDFQANNVKLSAIIELACSNVNTVYIEEIKGADKLKNIINSIYREEYIKDLGKMSAAYIKTCIYIACNIKYYKIFRPINKFTVQEQIKLIEDRMEVRSIEN